MSTKAKLVTISNAVVEGQLANVQVLATGAPDDLTGGDQGNFQVYNADNTYQKGSIVVVLNSVIGLVGGGTVTTQTGIYGAVFTADFNIYPQFPENKTWHFLNYLPRPVSTCAGGIMNLQCSDPF